jgi:hypothetical protein
MNLNLVASVVNEISSFCFHGCQSILVLTLRIDMRSKRKISAITALFVGPEIPEREAETRVEFDRRDE